MAISRKDDGALAASRDGWRKRRNMSERGKAKELTERNAITWSCGFSFDACISHTHLGALKVGLNSCDALQQI